MSNPDKKTLPVESSEPPLDTEGLLLQRLKNSTSDEDYFRWLLFIVGFYRGVQKIDAAIEMLNRFIETSQNHEHIAHCHLALGQIATDEQRIDTAMNHFNEALRLQPQKRKVKYVLHNNIGYCLNKLGRYVEGEKHCRLAIEIDWNRASGYRNLGVSLQGQGNVLGSAWALVEATKADVNDGRARTLLDKLIAANPNLALQCPWLNVAPGLDSKTGPELPMM
jgi:tetratricopeptide (TPR) repeat protein